MAKKMIRRTADLGYEAHGLTQCGQTKLMQLRLLLTQHLLAVAAMVVWRCSRIHRSCRSNGSIAPDLKLTFRCTLHELTCRGQSCRSLQPRINERVSLRRAVLPASQMSTAGNN